MRRDQQWGQMYKIYINESELILCKSRKIKKVNRKYNPEITTPYRGKQKHLLNYIDMLEKSPKEKLIVIHAEDYSQLKQDFLNLFIITPACGGLVLNENNEILFIFRRGYWDLPKGKMEGVETKKETAIREVEEETGIHEVKIIQKLGKTKHVFRTQSNNRAIKISYWYLMKTKKQKLTPQKNEDIEQAEWMTLEDFFNKKRPIYRSIKELLIKWNKKYR